jgi:REG-2-like HAD superfamily hydrolase
MNFLAKNLQKFKVITFDCTNTLFFFKKPREIQYLITAESFGFKRNLFDENLIRVNLNKQFVELQESHPNFGLNSIKYENWWKTLVVNVFAESSREKIDRKALEPVAVQLINQFKTRESWGKFEKSNEIIKGFKDAGKKVGIISNFDPRLSELLNDMNFPQFDFIITSYECGHMKPDPAIFQKALEASGVNCEPSEALHIGNEIDKDYNGARNVGWHAIMIEPEASVQPSFKNIEVMWKKIRESELKL